MACSRRRSRRSLPGCPSSRAAGRWRRRRRSVRAGPSRRRRCWTCWCGWWTSRWCWPRSRDDGSTRYRLLETLRQYGQRAAGRRRVRRRWCSAGTPPTTWRWRSAPNSELIGPKQLRWLDLPGARARQPARRPGLVPRSARAGAGRRGRAGGGDRPPPGRCPALVLALSGSPAGRAGVAGAGAGAGRLPLRRPCGPRPCAAPASSRVW